MSRRKTALSRFNAAEKRATLKRLRAMATPEDRALPELTPTPPPIDHQSPRSTYSRCHYWAETIEELSTRCGEHGEAAMAYARYGIIRSWLTKLSDYSMLTHSYRQSVDSLRLVGDEDLFRLGLPTTDGATRKPVLDGLSIEARCEALRIATDTIADYERAGSPLPSGADLVKRCTQAQQFVVNVVRMAEEAKEAMTLTTQEI